MTSRFVTSPDGIRIAVHESGNPDGPTIVAVHFETVSHSTQTRADLRALALPNVVVPDDGATVD